AGRLGCGADEPGEREPARLVQARPRLAEAIALRGEAAEPERIVRTFAECDGAGLDAELADEHHGELLGCDVDAAPGRADVENGPCGRQVDEEVVALGLDLLEGIATRTGGPQGFHPFASTSDRSAVFCATSAIAASQFSAVRPAPSRIATPSA